MTKEHALLRLQQSRARLRATMMPRENTSAGSSASSKRPLAALWRRWRRQWRQTPMVDMALGALQGWWAAQPWRPVAEQVGAELQAHVGPTVRRHPWAALGLAASAGAGLVLLRPWRWAPVRANGTVLRRRLMQAGLQFATQLPLQAVLAPAGGDVGGAPCRGARSTF